MGVVEFLQDLVRIPSVNGRHDETAVAQRILEEAKKLDIECKLHASPNAPNRPNAVACIGTGDPLFIFVAHSDTVTEGRVEDWSSDPFAANIVDGKMIGRGTADNKGGIAAALYALHSLKSSFDLTKGKIFMAAVVDEESGACSPDGLAYLLKEKIVGGKGAIYCHIGSRVTIGHRGLVRLVLSVRGQAVHSGIHEWCTGEKGSNASMALCEALYKIEKFDWPACLHESFPRLRFTVTPGTLIKGGEYESVVPPYAEGMIEIRTMPGQNQEEIIEQIRKIVDDVIARRNQEILSVHSTNIYPNPQLLTFNISIKNQLACSYIPPSHPLSQACVKAVEEKIGEKVKSEGCGPANEGYMLMNQGIPTICGFGYAGGHPHSPDEWVGVESLKKTVEVYESVVQKYCVSI